ncbi:pollen-specific leucine-rich repeat extensin-like protein 1 isoform X4 [Pomacea canaliculata]|uniref:pollen-specific leucine-rich repeat extensin-like protein 1 isoform X4 n=1 Tax=Pomacea canaliculata TaxID=400727 RepID=UPI000D729FD7|nr:pollen-specific leucine-rich repeat extensin-like protein 1 isoform X4 [Pomacea canaliculata]
MAFLDRWKQAQNSKSKPKTPPAVPSAKTKEGNSLFSEKEEEVKDVSSAKGKTEHPAAVTKKSEEKRLKSGSLFGANEDEDDLFSAVAKPKESGKKKPAGGVALFGGADILGKKNESESEAPKEEPPAPVPVPAAKSTPQKKLVSLFDADEEDEQDLFGPTLTTAPEKSDSRKDRSKSLFEDEDVLFGTTEESPSVNIFSKSPPAPAQKPKAEPATHPSKDTPAPFSKPAKETLAPLTQPPKKETPASLTQPDKKEKPAPLTQPTKETPGPVIQPAKKETPAPLIAKKEVPPLATPPTKETPPPLAAGRATGSSATKATSSALFDDDEDDEDLFGVSTKKSASKTLPIGELPHLSHLISQLLKRNLPNRLQNQFQNKLQNLLNQRNLLEQCQCLEGLTLLPC